MHKIDYLARCAERYALVSCLEDMRPAVTMMENCHSAGGKILTCGNGGSAADAEHIVGELMKGFLSKRPLLASEKESLMAAGADRSLLEGLQRPIAALSLVAGVALPTAYANDVDPENVFAQQVFGLGRPDDVLIGISTSGKSRNVINACIVAKSLGMKTIGITKHGHTPLHDVCDVTIGVPADSTPDIQELHLPVYHALCAELEQRIFG